jgi:hypothetical protein
MCNSIPRVLQGLHDNSNQKVAQMFLGFLWVMVTST